MCDRRRRSKWPRWCSTSLAIRLIDYALTETVLTLKSQWYPALERGELSFDNQPDRVAFVLTADGTTDVTQIVRRFSERPELTDDARAPLWAMLAKAGEPDDLRYALRSRSCAIRWFSTNWPWRPRSGTKCRGESWPSR